MPGCIGVSDALAGECKADDGCIAAVRAAGAGRIAYSEGAGALIGIVEIPDGHRAPIPAGVDRVFLNGQDERRAVEIGPGDGGAVVVEAGLKAEGEHQLLHARRIVVEKVGSVMGCRDLGLDVAHEAFGLAHDLNVDCV